MSSSKLACTDVPLVMETGNAWHEEHDIAHHLKKMQTGLEPYSVRGPDIGPFILEVSGFKCCTSGMTIT